VVAILPDAAGITVKDPTRDPGSLLGIADIICDKSALTTPLDAEGNLLIYGFNFSDGCLVKPYYIRVFFGKGDSLRIYQGWPKKLPKRFFGLDFWEIKVQIPSLREFQTSSKYYGRNALFTLLKFTVVDPGKKTDNESEAVWFPVRLPGPVLGNVVFALPEVQMGYNAQGKKVGEDTADYLGKPSTDPDGDGGQVRWYDGETIQDFRNRTSFPMDGNFDPFDLKPDGKLYFSLPNPLPSILATLRDEGQLVQVTEGAWHDDGVGFTRRKGKGNGIGREARLAAPPRKHKVAMDGRVAKSQREKSLAGGEPGICPQASDVAAALGHDAGGEVLLRFRDGNFHCVHRAHLPKIPTAIHGRRGFRFFRHFYGRGRMNFPFANLRHVLRNSNEAVGIDAQQACIHQVIGHNCGVNGGGAASFKNLLRKFP